MKITAESFSQREAMTREKALNYLKSKFPDADEHAFFTDYSGRTFDEVLQFWEVYQASEIDGICENCEGNCKLPESIKSRNSRPMISVSESPKGFSFLDVSWTCGLNCKFKPSEEFERMFMISGISSSYRNMTFNAYECSRTDTESRKARLEAMKASDDGSCLILSGKPGTGKTHLAVAIALRAMEHGHQAIFRLVSSMLDEIQSVISLKGDYDVLMRQFKTVPCLVLDDLGHENMTPARASYLHQIIDYRYAENFQTIVTTNALTPSKLYELSGEEFIAPVISRLLGHGSWVTITNVPDRRYKHVS